MQVDRLFNPYTILPFMGPKKEVTPKENTFSGFKFEPRHFPSVSPSFKGNEFDDAFWRAGGYTFLGKNFNKIA